MKKSLFLIVILFSTLVAGEIVQAQAIPQTDPSRLLSNPRRAAHTFVHWQMKGHERFDLSALTMMAKQELTQEERIEKAQQLLKVLDSRGLLIDFDVIPMDPAYEDTLSGLHQYIMFKNLPQVYLVKKDSLWMFSEATIDAIPDLYRDTFSIFVDVVLDNLPASMHNEWLGFYIWQYIALFIWVLIGLVLRKLAEFFMEGYAKKLTAKTETKWDDYVVVQTEKTNQFSSDDDLFQSHIHQSDATGER
jgi:MscS family membrane protein